MEPRRAMPPSRPDVACLPSMAKLRPLKKWMRTGMTCSGTSAKILDHSGRCRHPPKKPSHHLPKIIFSLQLPETKSLTIPRLTPLVSTTRRRLLLSPAYGGCVITGVFPLLRRIAPRPPDRTNPSVQFRSVQFRSLTIEYFAFGRRITLLAISRFRRPWLRFYKHPESRNWLRCAKQPFSKTWFRKKRLSFAF